MRRAGAGARGAHRPADGPERGPAHLSMCNTRDWGSFERAQTPQSSMQCGAQVLARGERVDRLMDQSEGPRTSASEILGFGVAFERA